MIFPNNTCNLGITATLTAFKDVRSTAEYAMIWYCRSEDNTDTTRGDTCTDTTNDATATAGQCTCATAGEEQQPLQVACSAENGAVNSCDLQ